MLPPITDILLSRLPHEVSELGLKRYAFAQLVSWLYAKRASSFGEMTDLSKEARSLLEQRYRLSALSADGALVAADSTTKLILSTADGLPVECVLIPADDGRATACLSTQAGCAMGCSFCRTAGMGFIRNLTQGEIVGQLIELQRAMDKARPSSSSSSGMGRDSGRQITNVVFMGMGEPLRNMDAVLSSIEIFRERRAFNLSGRRITLSTCGLIPELREFAGLSDVKIAISLNATTDEVRQTLMPVNKLYPISEIVRFAREYGERSRHRVTFEYVMMRGINDSREDASRLLKLLSGVRSKVNLIPFNPYEGSHFEAPEMETVEWWGGFLRGRGMQVNIRASRGREIMAACGQLAAAGSEKAES